MDDYHGRIKIRGRGANEERSNGLGQFELGMMPERPPCKGNGSSAPQVARVASQAKPISDEGRRCGADSI